MPAIAGRAEAAAPPPAFTALRERKGGGRNGVGASPRASVQEDSCGALKNARNSSKSVPMEEWLEECTGAKVRLCTPLQARERWGGSSSVLFLTVGDPPYFCLP